MSPGNQILALTARKAKPNRLTIAKGKTFVLIKPNYQELIKLIITRLLLILKTILNLIILY